MFIKKDKGFTLVEVMVSLSIMGLLMSTVLYNYGNFNDRLALSAAAQEIAIAVRQAQTYGLTVKEVSVGALSTSGFSSAYGVYFDYNAGTDTYYIFADKNANLKYDVGSGGCQNTSTECIEKFYLRNGIRISGVCDATTCPPVATARMLNVTFLRPNPDATIIFTNTSGTTVSGPSLTGKVTLVSNKGNTATVIIESTGQVFVQ